MKLSHGRPGGVDLSLSAGGAADWLICSANASSDTFRVWISPSKRWAREFRTRRWPLAPRRSLRLPLHLARWSRQHHAWQATSLV